MLGEMLGRGTSRSEENLREHDCSSLLESVSAFGEALGGRTSASALGGILGNGTSTSQGNPRGSDGPSRKGALDRESVSEEPRFPSSSFFLEQRHVSSSFSPRKCRHTAPTKLSPSSVKHVSHLGRTSPDCPSLPYVPSGDSQPASRADLVRADPLKAQDGYSLETSSRMGGRSWIEGVVPAGRVGGQDVTPEPFRSSRTSPVKSLSRSRRTLPVGDLSHLRLIYGTD